MSKYSGLLTAGKHMTLIRLVWLALVHHLGECVCEWVYHAHVCTCQQTHLHVHTHHAHRLNYSS